MKQSPRLSFEEGDKPDDIPYRFDGDEAMEHADARKKRRALRKHPQVVQWLKVFFRTFRDHDDTSGVPKAEYLEVHMLMTKSLHKYCRSSACTSPLRFALLLAASLSFLVVVGWG